MQAERFAPEARAALATVTQELAALGYDVTRLDAARAAFRRHFLAEESGGALSERDRALLTCLVMRKRE